MPLDRDELTVASRVMLPTYAALCALFGVVFVLDPQGRLSRAPSLDLARDWLPLWAWGALWLGLAAAMEAARRVGSRHAFLLGLGLCMGSWIAWGGVLEGAVFVNDDVSFLAGVLPWFVARACWASLRSLLAKES